MRRLKQPARVQALLLLLLSLVACSNEPTSTPPPPPTTPPAVLLNLGVTEHAAALAEAWTAAYRTETEQATVNFVSGNNAALFDDLDDEQLDAILVHHIPEGAPSAEAEPWFSPIALDGLVIVVNEANPVTSLSAGQVQSLFSGESGNWSAVGGTDLAVVPFEQERGDGARILFSRRIMGARPVSINTIVQSSSAALLAAVAETPGAIGYTMMSALGEGTGNGVQAVAFDTIAPTAQNTATQEYPLTAPLYFVARAEPQGELRAFLAWLQSSEGQAIVSETVGTVR